MKGLFYDTCGLMLKKNHLNIASYFQKKHLDFRTCFISNEIGSNLKSLKNSEAEKDLLKLTNSTYIKLKSFNHTKIQSLITQEKPDFIFIAGYRIYDQLICGISNSLKIPIYKLQHGFEIDSVNYQVSSFIFKITKILRLLRATHSLSNISQTNSILLAYQYCSYILVGRKPKNSLLNNKLFHPTLVFVYSEFYKNFWFEKFGLDKKKMHCITPFDFKLIPRVKKQKLTNGCCYIAQTLVEDGRMSKFQFIKHLKSYEELIQNVDSFYIKLHPRSNLDHYKNLLIYPNVKVGTELPHYSVYLSHYSSLLYTVAFISKHIIIHELPGHRTPEIFKQIKPRIYNSIKHIIKDLRTIDSKINIHNELVLKEKLKNFVEYKDLDPLEDIYKQVFTTKLLHQ